uniref:NADH dehydrogenase subunit 6 n=1 Tax=Aradacanthia heissi TaxID=928818 RepID=I6LNM5_9HEMI|nr:NADH dehydrogenase subunit 6 [Aradacanthia heissi]
MMKMAIMMASCLPFLTHPLSMGLILIMESILIAMIVGMMNNSFFMSFILIITMVSGMLVLFIYMSSVASNKKFKPSMKIIWLVVVSSIITSTMLKSSDMENHTLQFNMMTTMNTKNITIMLILYLLITMIVVSNIVNIQEGPLRKKS